MKEQPLQEDPEVEVEVQCLVFLLVNVSRLLHGGNALRVHQLQRVLTFQRSQVLPLARQVEVIVELVLAQQYPYKKG